ncbi:MAG: hypothetical protein K6U11_03545 [bacterium]|nr:hypothetical protein [bacterium]
MVPQALALPQQRCSQVRQVARWLCTHQHFLFLAHIADARLYGVPHAPALPDRARAFRRTEKALEALLQGRGSQTAPKTTTGELKNIMPALIIQLGKLMISKRRYAAIQFTCPLSLIALGRILRVSSLGQSLNAKSDRKR